MALVVCKLVRAINRLTKNNTTIHRRLDAPNVLYSWNGRGVDHKIHWRKINFSTPFPLILRQTCNAILLVEWEISRNKFLKVISFLLQAVHCKNHLPFMCEKWMPLSGRWWRNFSKASLRCWCLGTHLVGGLPQVRDTHTCTGYPGPSPPGLARRRGRSWSVVPPTARTRVGD